MRAAAAGAEVAPRGEEGEEDVAAGGAGAPAASPPSDARAATATATAPARVWCGDEAARAVPSAVKRAGAVRVRAGRLAPTPGED